MVIKRFFEEHQTVASILTIIASMIVINGWMVSDIRENVNQIHADVRETNKRIDALFHYVLTKEKM